MRSPTWLVSAMAILSAACGGSSAVGIDTDSPVGTPESVAVGPSAPASAPPVSAGKDAGAGACDPLGDRATPLALGVLPDVGMAPFVAAISGAKTKIAVMVYQMGYGAILDNLEAKAKAGVAVRVVLDVSQKATNEKYMTRLAAAGATVIWSDPKFQFMHAKVIVVDDEVAVLSTGNYSASYMAKERNYVVTDADPADVAVLASLFEADFTRTVPDLSCTRLVVSPENSKARLLAFIASAKTEILVESMQLADFDVRKALADRKAAGVDVRVILADPAWITANKAAGTFLASKGIPARWLASPGVHVKAIVVDAAAYVGSENLSTTSLTKNREVGLILREPTNLASMRTTFDKDWAAAAPL